MWTGGLLSIDGTSANSPAFGQNTWIASWVYIIAGSTSKLALLVFYLRISPQRLFRLSVYTAMCFISCYTIGLIFPTLFGCRPIERSFNALIKEANCINAGALYIAMAVFNVVSDVILFILPIPMVFGLQMPLRQRLGLFFVFGIGSA